MPGALLTPAGQRPKTALVAAHYNVDFAEHDSAPYFAARGFGFLRWNTRYRGAEDQFMLEQALVDIGVGVRRLREEAGTGRVVILGNFGGGSLMGAYQTEAAAPTLRSGQQHGRILRRTGRGEGPAVTAEGDPRDRLANHSTLGLGLIDFKGASGVVGPGRVDPRPALRLWHLGETPCALSFSPQPPR